jgi:hypothetical protein
MLSTLSEEERVNIEVFNLEHGFNLNTAPLVLACVFRRNGSIVTHGRDARVHLLRKKMDCRVRPGNDEYSQYAWEML